MPTDKPLPYILPGMPYTVVELVFGSFTRPTRQYKHGGHGDILSDEEIKVWKVVQGLHKALEAAVEELTAVREGPVGNAVTGIVENPALTAAFSEYVGGVQPQPTPLPAGGGARRSPNTKRSA